MNNLLDFYNTKKSFVSESLSTIPDNRNLLLISFSVTDRYAISIFRKYWDKFDKEWKAYGTDQKSTEKIGLNQRGGCITIIDLHINEDRAPEILAEKDLNIPYGAYFHEELGELLVCCSMNIVGIKNGEIVRIINNNLFNNLHSIEPSKNGLLITSTGTDSIIEIDPQQPEIPKWEWIATEHGFSKTPLGLTRLIDKSVNYQKEGNISTKKHTTHLNSAIEYDEDHILATLFHQDKLIKINRKTKNFEVIFEDLVNPHGIHKHQDGYIISDTRGNRAIIMDKHFNVTRVLENGYDWVQDSIEFAENTLVANDNKAVIDIFNNKFKLSKQIKWEVNSRLLSNLYLITAKSVKKTFIG